MRHIRAVRRILSRQGATRLTHRLKAHDVESGFLIVHQLGSHFRSIGSAGCGKLRCGDFLEHPACQQVGLGMTGFRRSGLTHVVNDLAGYLGGTYVIGSIRQCLLDVLYFVQPRLIHRLVQGSNMVQEGLYPCHGGRLFRAGIGARSRAVRSSNHQEYLSIDQA
jgi:hypothetical protein